MGREECPALFDGNRIRACWKSTGCGAGVDGLNYAAFTDDSLKMMYEAVRGALASDDGLKAQKEEPRFRVRETPEWKRHAADLEMELIRRGVSVDVIDWSGGQPELPL
jgi:hypothetical protein